MALPIGFISELLSDVGPSSCLDKCFNESSFVSKRQINYCNGCPNAFSKFCITPPLEPVFILVLSQLTTRISEDASILSISDNMQLITQFIVLHYRPSCTSTPAMYIYT